MTLRRKLLLSMVIPALLLALVGGIGLFSLWHLEQAAGRILADNYRSIQEARRMSRALRHLEAGAGELRPGRQDAREEFEEALGRCKANITEIGEMEVLNRIREAWNRLPAPAAPSLPVDPSLYQAIEELVALNEQAMFAYERETRGVARGMLTAVALGSLAALLALALFALVSAYRIARPVTEAADRLHKALNPAFHPAPRSERIYEIARLREELDALLARLAHHESEQARKLSRLQDRLAFVIDEVLEGLVLIDADLRVMAANRVGRAILGIEGDLELSAEAPRPPENVQSLLASIEQGTFQPERDLGEFRFELDGAERVFRPRVLTVPTSEGGIEGYLVLFWDVTEQRRFEESRRRFISMLSHQLKTPMTSLSMAVNLIRERLCDPAHAELLAIASESCNSLAALVSELIEAARENPPDLALQLRSVDLARLLRAALRPLVSQAEEKEIELILPPEAPALPAAVDPVKFPWVVTNIAGNALRYTPRRGRIEVAARLTGKRLEVSVTDNGSGITPENLERIFLPYVSSDPDPQPGTHGLGLAIAREIVEAHGGTIEASSEPGRGTCFVIRMPTGMES